LTNEFGGNNVAAFQLPATSGSGTPAMVDYVAAGIPADPTGSFWAMGLDPHTVTAYESPSSHKALALMSNQARTFLAIVDLQALLAAPRVAGTHTVDPSVDLVATGVVSFVSIH